MWLRVAGWCLLFVSTAYAARRVQQYVSTDRQFFLQRGERDAFTIQGAQYASRTRIAGMFQHDFGKSIYAVPLAERRRRLLAIDWIEDATVARVWPNRLVVWVTERKPVAFVNLKYKEGNMARVALIDRFGALLDLPPGFKQGFPVLNGIFEEQPEAQRQERVTAMLQLMEDLGALSRAVSEVNAAAPDNLTLIAQVEGRALELIMGDGNYARRFQNFLGHYPEIKRRSEHIRLFDLRLDDRITAKDGHDVR